jgi:hypothetical protein
MSFWGDKPTTTTGTSMGQYPEWMKKDMLEAQKAYKTLYESNLDRGYRPYTGMTTAGFTPEQIASQQGLASLVGSQAPLQQEALGLTRGLSSEFTPDQAQKYMSPYLRASLDAQKAAAQRQFEGTKLPQFEAEAVAAGGMSGLGSRAGVQAAELQAGQNRLMADLEATGQQKAYEDAQNLFKSQKEREKQSALALQNLNKEMFSGSLKEQALLDAIGTEKQQMAQTMLDEAQAKYYDKEEFARNELNKWYQSLLGNPIWKQPNYQTTGTQGGGGPGIGKTLMSLAGIIGGMGGFKLPFMKGGGSIGDGLASTSQARPYMNYMRRNMGGQVVPPVVYRQKPGSVMSREDKIKRLNELEAMKIKSLLRRGGLKLPDSSKDISSSITNPLGLPKKRAKLPPLPTKQTYGLPPQIPEEVVSEEGELPLGTQVKTGTGLQSALKAIKEKKLSDTPQAVDTPQAELTGSAPDARDADDTEAAFGAMERMGKVIGGWNNGRPIWIDAAASKKTGKDYVDNLVIDGVNATKKSIDGQVAAKAKQITSNESFNTKFAADVRKDIKTYTDKVEARIGDDPYQRQKFWFTVAAAIGKPGGNAFTNLANGLKEATSNLDLDRKEKNKLLNALDKQKFNLETKVKEKELAANLKGVELTEAQETLLAKKGQFIFDAVIKAMNAGASFQKALAAARKEERKAKENKTAPKFGQAQKYVTDRLKGISNLPMFSSGNPIGKGAESFKNELILSISGAGSTQEAARRYKAAIDKWNKLSSAARQSFPNPPPPPTS